MFCLARLFFHVLTFAGSPRKPIVQTYSPWPQIIYPHAGEFSNVVHHKPNVTVLDDWKRCLCVCRPPILGHNRRLYCHGNW